MAYYTFGHGYELTANESLKEIAITTAHSLATRFSPVVGCIRSWNGPHFKVIIDNMMNLELLFWAASASNNETLRAMAVSHATRMATCGMIREDGCSYHLVDFNETSGAVISRSSLPQGYSSDSIWSRGQAWAVYGYVIAYRYTGDPVFLRMAEQAASCFLNQLKSCCSDNVPLFDFAYPGRQRDTSAGAIVASGLVELAWQTGNPSYRAAAKDILDGLTSPAYLGVPDQTDTMLLHSVGAWPDGEWDLPESYADYYLLEAVIKYRRSQ